MARSRAGRDRNTHSGARPRQASVVSRAKRDDIHPLVGQPSSVKQPIERRQQFALSGSARFAPQAASSVVGVSWTWFGALLSIRCIL